MIVACTALGGVPLWALADEAGLSSPGASSRGWSFGAGLGVVEYREPDLHSTEPDFIYLQAGWRFNSHLMVAARLGTDAPGSGDSLSFSAPLPVRIRRLYGIYARGAVPILSHCELYGLAGYASVHWESDVDIAALHGSTGSASYAMGFSWNASPGFSVDLELMPELARGAGWHSDALAIGIRWHY
jgi:hypothetical protein